MKTIRLTSLALTLLLVVSCGRKVSVSETSEDTPEIFPDYAGVTVPVNIAPLNFSYVGSDEPAVLIVSGKSGDRQIKGKKGLFSFPSRTWKSLMAENSGDDITLTVAVKRGEKWVSLKPFTISVSPDEIDPYLSYRLIPPGYQAWKKMGIYQRCLETYSQTAVFENSLTGGNCVNCHTYCQRDPSRMLFHARSEFGGTAMILNDKVEKLNTKTDSTISALVYPYWHPSGKYVAFSVNKTNQNFFSHNENRIEVYDSESDVVVYDVESHEIFWSALTALRTRSRPSRPSRQTDVAFTSALPRRSRRCQMNIQKSSTASAALTSTPRAPRSAMRWTRSTTERRTTEASHFQEYPLTADSLSSLFVNMATSQSGTRTPTSGPRIFRPVRYSRLTQPIPTMWTATIRGAATAVGWSSAAVVWTAFTQGLSSATSTVTARLPNLSFSLREALWSTTSPR